MRAHLLERVGERGKSRGCQFASYRPSLMSGRWQQRYFHNLTSDILGQALTFRIYICMLEDGCHGSLRPLITITIDRHYFDAFERRDSLSSPCIAGITTLLIRRV